MSLLHFDQHLRKTALRYISNTTHATCSVHRACFISRMSVETRCGSLKSSMQNRSGASHPESANRPRSGRGRINQMMVAAAHHFQRNALRYKEMNPKGAFAGPLSLVPLCALFVAGIRQKYAVLEESTAVGNSDKLSIPRQNRGVYEAPRVKSFLRPIGQLPLPRASCARLSNAKSASKAAPSFKLVTRAPK